MNIFFPALIVIKHYIFYSILFLIREEHKMLFKVNFFRSRRKGVNMGILLCFCVKITFVWKNNKFFTFVNDYSMFTKWVETKHSFISIISIWNVRFRKSLKNRTRKIGVQMSSNPPKKSRKLVQNAFEQDKIIENNRKFIFCRKKYLP